MKIWLQHRSQMTYIYLAFEVSSQAMPVTLATRNQPMLPSVNKASSSRLPMAFCIAAQFVTSHKHSKISFSKHRRRRNQYRQCQRTVSSLQEEDDSDGSHIHEVELDMPARAVQDLHVISGHAKQYIHTCNSHGALLLAKTRSRRYHWPLDQVLYDVGVRHFAAPRDSEQLRNLRDRLPEDARYYVLLSPATIAKKAKKLVGVVHAYSGLIEGIGAVRDIDTAIALNEAAASSSHCADCVRVFLSGSSSICDRLSSFVGENCQNLKVVGLYLDAAQFDVPNLEEQHDIYAAIFQRLASVNPDDLSDFTIILGITEMNDTALNISRLFRSGKRISLMVAKEIEC